jgi:hypothetical protein
LLLPFYLAHSDFTISFLPLQDNTKGQKDLLRWSIILGTSIALVIFLLWQWLIIGAIPKNILQETLMQGLPVTQALQNVTGRPYLFFIGQFFAFFALTTSLLGVCFYGRFFSRGVCQKEHQSLFLDLVNLLSTNGLRAMESSGVRQSSLSGWRCWGSYLKWICSYCLFFDTAEKMNVQLTWKSKVVLCPTNFFLLLGLFY